MDWLWTHTPRLRRLLRRRGRSPEDADDLIQELFLRVMLYCRDGRQIHKPDHFLARSVLNLAAKQRDREHRDLYIASPIEELILEDPVNTPDEHVVADQVLERLQRTLNSLETRTREVYVMHRLHGLSYEQIAEHFEISTSAIEKHMAKATIALTQEMLNS